MADNFDDDANTMLSTPPSGLGDDQRLVSPPSPKGTWALPKAAVIIGAILLLAIGFVGGIFVGKVTAGSSTPERQQGNYQQGGRTGMMPSGAPGAGSGGTAGTITGISGNTITITTRAGTTKTIAVSSTTTIKVLKAGGLSDLATGDTITVAGSTSNDTVDATSITEGGLTGFGGGMPDASAPASSK